MATEVTPPVTPPVPPSYPNRPTVSPSSTKIISYLQKIREPIADYQDAKGLSKAEKYSFVQLVTALCQHAYNAGVIILTMLYNLLPLCDGATYFIRFALDKLIDIFETQDPQDRIIKSVMFVGQLIILFVLLYFIISILLMPILQLTMIFIHKIIKMTVGAKE